jgi:hypothetical protein
VAKFLWPTMLFTFGVQPSVDVSNLLGSWLAGFSHKHRKPLLVGVVTLCWAIWLTRNDAVFN